jgi:4-hydroxybenzoate polyprenyltransferase
MVNSVHVQSKPQPATSRLARIAAYILEMFPPLVSVPAALMNFGAVYFAVQALEGHAPLQLTWRGVAGALTTTLFFLILRVYDELKDVETDLRLGRAGDPRYKDRAIVTGRIQVADLKFLRWIVTGLLFLINLPLGFPMPFLAFIGVFGVTWLSFHWFFWPAVSRSLLLAFATHNPMALAVGAYAAAVAVRDFGSIDNKGSLFVLLVGIWTSIAAWEVSRKVRAQADETAYMTYSKVLGWRQAGLAPLLFVLISAACFTWVAVALGLPWIYRAIVLVATTIVAGACIRFELRPNSVSANLRPYAEMFGLVAVGGFLASLLLHFSFTLR